MRKRNTFTVTAKRTGRKVLLTLSGYIYQGHERNSSQAIADALKQVRKGDKLTLMIRNCNGGSVIEGITMYHDIAAYKPTVLVEGVAASMGAILALCGKEVKMSKHSRLMFHRVLATLQGDPDQIADELENVREYEDQLAEIIAQKTGFDDEKVRSTFLATGKDKWLTAEQARKFGLVDDVISGSLLREVKVDDLDNSKQPMKVLARFEAAMRKPEPKRAKRTPLAMFKKKKTATAAKVSNSLTLLGKAKIVTSKLLARANKYLVKKGVTNAFLMPVTPKAKNAKEVSALLNKRMARIKGLKAKLALSLKAEAASQKRLAALGVKLTASHGEVRRKRDPEVKSSKKVVDPLAVVHDPNQPWNAMADRVLGAPDPNAAKAVKKKKKRATAEA